MDMDMDTDLNKDMEIDMNMDIDMNSFSIFRYLITRLIIFLCFSLPNSTINLSSQIGCHLFCGLNGQVAPR
jgi:hypothetical protein